MIRGLSSLGFWLQELMLNVGFFTKIQIQNLSVGIGQFCSLTVATQTLVPKTQNKYHYFVWILCDRKQLFIPLQFLYIQLYRIKIFQKFRQPCSVNTEYYLKEKHSLLKTIWDRLLKSPLIFYRSPYLPIHLAAVASSYSNSCGHADKRKDPGVQALLQEIFQD